MSKVKDSGHIKPLLSVKPGGATEWGGYFMIQPSANRCYHRIKPILGCSTRPCKEQRSWPIGME